MTFRRHVYVRLSTVVLIGLLNIAAVPGYARPSEVAARPSISIQTVAHAPCPPPAPGPLPRPPGCSRVSWVSPEDLCLRLTAKPSSTTIPSGTVTYRLVAQNNGSRRASNIRVTLPFALDGQTVLDANFTKPNAWVSAILTDSIEMQVGSLDSDETFIATLRLRTAPNAQIGTSIATRARVDWDGQGNTALSNRVSLTIARADASNPTVPLELAPAIGDPATSFAIAYDGFASREKVSIWYHHPDGHVVALGEMRADAQGQINFNMPSSHLDRGRYTLVGYGQCSQVSAVGMFTVTAK